MAVRRKVAHLASRKAKRQKWSQPRKAEVGFGAGLKQIARNVGQLVRSLTPEDPTPESTGPLRTALVNYSTLLEPWARQAVAKMVGEVDRLDQSMWRAHSKEIGRELRYELRNTPVGAALRDRMAEQVELIKSLPLQAAQRVHRMTQAALLTGERSPTIAAKIYATGHVTLSRAKLIARTEVARTAATLTQTRAQAVGSEGYIWRTSEDADVRSSHRKMDGKYVRWSEPPTLDGMTGHAGEFPNCRCYIEPVLPDEDEVAPPATARRFTTVDAAIRRGAGVVLVSPQNRVLLLRRAASSASHPNTWGLPAGGIDAGETPLQAAVRECWEETGYHPRPEALSLVWTSAAFTCFTAVSLAEFTPTLNDEHTGYVWAALDELPTQLHPNLRAQLVAALGEEVTA